MRHLLTAAAAGAIVLALTGCAAATVRTTAAAPRPPAAATTAATAATAPRPPAAATPVAATTPVSTPAPVPTRIAIVDAADLTPEATPSVSSVPPASAAPSLFPFATPQAAMRYLADAYNHNDTARLRKVTTPLARQALDQMRAEAVNLRLVGCDKQPAGDYLCHFAHDYPASLPLSQRDGTTGHAEFLVGPATKQGWYMTVFESCG